MPTQLQRLVAHRKALHACRRCPKMTGPVVTGEPVMSPVLLVGQAPGTREIVVGRPFAWTAGRTLFGWFASIGLDEEAYRRRVYMAAVCRCFPGKRARGGDRVPSREEVVNCSDWLEAEIALLRPGLILPVGKLAIGRFLAMDKLTDVIGVAHARHLHGYDVDIIPLPHPSGASTWHRTDPGKQLLVTVLGLIKRHAAWKQVCSADVKSGQIEKPASFIIPRK